MRSFLQNNSSILSIFILLCILKNTRAQSMDLPVELQYPLFLKIFSFDRNLKTRSVSGFIIIGILYQSKFSNSNAVKNDLTDHINNSLLKTINNIPVTFITIDYNSESELKQLLSEQKISVLYLTPMRSADIQNISLICRQSGILTCSGVPDYIYGGLSVGLAMKNERPNILINIKSAKSEGTDFDTQLLKISTLIN